MEWGTLLTNPDKWSLQKVGRGRQSFSLSFQPYSYINYDGGFLKFSGYPHATPSYHPIFHRIFHEINNWFRGSALRCLSCHGCVAFVFLSVGCRWYISWKIPIQNGWLFWEYPHDESETSIYIIYTHNIYIYIWPWFMSHQFKFIWSRHLALTCNSLAENAKVYWVNGSEKVVKIRWPSGDHFAVMYPVFLLMTPTMWGPPVMFVG